MFHRIPLASFFLLLVLAAGAAPAWAQSGDLVPLVVGAGDSLAVRFEEPFCSDKFEVGDVVPAVVADDKVISEHVVVSAGATVVVEVAEKESNGRGGKPGAMTLVFKEVEAVDGARIPFDAATSTVARDGHGRNIVAKFLTLFLIKGTTPCVGGEERFFPKVAKTMPVMVPASR